MMQCSAVTYHGYSVWKCQCKPNRGNNGGSRRAVTSPLNVMFLIMLVPLILSAILYLLLTNAAEKIAKTDEIGKTTGDIKGTMQAVVLSTAGILFSTPALAVSCTVLFADSLLKSSWTLTKLTGSGTFDVQALPNGLRVTIHAGGGSACVAHTRPSGGRLRSSGHPNGRLKLRANVPSWPLRAPGKSFSRFAQQVAQTEVRRHFPDVVARIMFAAPPLDRQSKSLVRPSVCVQSIRSRRSLECFTNLLR